MWIEDAVKSGSSETWEGDNGREEGSSSSRIG
jgi:hypothetical protein